MMRELRVEDALLYLDLVKVEFGDRPHIYNEFLDIMKTFKTQQIDTPGVIRRVSNLFQGNKKLVLGFNTFLPEGYKIELPMDGGDASFVYREPGPRGEGTVTRIVTGPPPSGPTSAQPGSAAVAAAAAAQAGGRPDTGGPQQMHMGQPGMHPHPSPQNLARGPPMMGQPKPPPGHDPSMPGAGAYNRAQPPMQMQPGGPRGQPPQPPQGMMSAMARAEAQHRGGPGAAIGIGPGHGLAPGPGPGQQGLGRGVHARPPQGMAGQLPGAMDGKIPPAQARMGPGGPHHLTGPLGAVMPPAGLPQQMGQPQPGQQQLAAQLPPVNVAPGNPPLEFDHAINYVTTIKKRFASEPETYKKFLEILHTYQKEQRGIKEVLDEVSVLFADHPDLLKEFTYFLPDAVQAQAKAQLDQVAKESEARLAAKASKEAIMQTAKKLQRPEAAQSRGPTAASGGAAARGGASFSAPAPSPIPFGATQGRSDERERDICRGAHFGVVSFASVRPPRRGELTPAQAAAKKGRPTAIPELPRHPNTSESSFFQRAKEHLNRKELAPDKPPGSRRHTPYTEFLKCLHLFGAGILTKEELVLLLRGLFMQGHAPKSGANAGGGVSNANVANDAHSLLREFEDILVGRGPYADQETTFKDKSKYGSLRTRDFDFSSCEKPTPSYRTMPSDYPQSLFITNPGESEQDAAVLNDEVVCVGAERSSRKHMTSSPEDYDGVRIRRNAYEEVLVRIEDERYEVDMAIERNAQAMRQLEPFAEEVSTLRENEEKDGQPIGRLQYQLKRYALNTIAINAIGRVYGENGDEVLQHLARNPLVVLPIVYQRLRQKDAEWRKAKAELKERWNALSEANYEGAIDYACYFYRKELERTFTQHQLLDDCKKARSYSKHPEKVKDHPATRAFTPEFARRCSDPEAFLFQPCIAMKLGSNAMNSHRYAFKVISTRIETVCGSDRAAEREKVGRIWAEFMVPWFGYPAHWVLDEVRDSFRGKLNPHVVKYTPGQRIRTTNGDATVLSFTEGNPSIGCRYRVKLPFGTAFIRPTAILHALPQRDGDMLVRRDGVFVKEKHPPSDDGGAVKLSEKFERLFATESFYIFMRMFCLLVSLLADTREHLVGSSSSKDPDDAYVVPPGFKADPEKQGIPKLDFTGVVAMLEKVCRRQIENKDFETYCRKVSKEKVYQMAVLPKLVDKCADALLQVAKEGILLHLYDYCQHKELDLIQVRSLCLATTPDASYRIQYDSERAHMFFSYLPEGESLLTGPSEDDIPHEDDNGDGEADAAMNVAEDDHEAEDAHDAGEDGIVDEGDATSGPPSKRVKLK